MAFAKSLPASWYNFRQWLEYFGEKFGREIIAVPPHFTSIECSNCGAKVQKSLSTRTHSCPHCGYVEQRDASGDVLSTSIGRKTCKSKERQ
ncbi:zinc ribbon domain-containing protein [Nostoc sp.]|uniref:zinc ribbon domain-containing protein n=1 Tax=Nostoc sp. TaxID=1180 RepID=UPI003FA59805